MPVTAPGARDRGDLRILEGYRPGCIGRVVEMHAAYYTQAVGFGVVFESMVARELADFCANFEAGRDGLWLAVGDGAIRGSVAIQRPRGPGESAHLRWFILSEEARGRGLGSRMLAAALDFCREREYPVDLWTFENLKAARHLYEKHGFRLARSQQGDRWGREVTEELYTLAR